MQRHVELRVFDQRLAQSIRVEADRLLKAAERGHKTAMRELATIYEMGLGVTSDDAKAAYWRERSK